MLDLNIFFERIPEVVHLYVRSELICLVILVMRKMTSHGRGPDTVFSCRLIWVYTQFFPPSPIRAAGEAPRQHRGKTAIVAIIK